MDVERERQAMNTPQIPDTSDLEDRIANLEAISAQTGGIPWQYQNSLTKLQGQVTFLQNKLNAALERGKQKAKQQVAKKQAEKPTYKGLNA